MDLARRRSITVSITIIAVVLATIYGLLPGSVEVDMAAAVRGPLQVTIEEEGRTRLKERFVVSAPISGVMQRIDAKVGDKVAKGQMVAFLEPLWSQTLDPRSRAEAMAVESAAAAALNAAMEKERAASADLDYLEKRLERTTSLYAQGYVAKDQYEQSESDVNKAKALRLSARAAVNVSRSELDRARVTLQSFTTRQKTETVHTLSISSPIAGSVFRVYRESEGTVSAGEPLMDIGNVEGLEVRVEVLSSNAVKIRKGTPVFFKRWGGELPLGGVVRIVEPAGFTKISSLGVEEQRVLAIVDLTSPPDSWSALGDGYRLEAHFVIWEGTDILQVPESALFRSGKDWAVFILENGKARKRLVEVGQRNGFWAEIRSGINEYQKVIAHPDEAISDGVRIRSRK